MKKLLSLIIATLMILSLALNMTGCEDLNYQLNEAAQKSPKRVEGYRADVWRNIEDQTYIRKNHKTYLLDFPKEGEEVTVPGNVAGLEVVQLGYHYIGLEEEEYYYVDLKGIKYLNINSLCKLKYVKNADDLERISYYGYPYQGMDPVEGLDNTTAVGVDGPEIWLLKGGHYWWNKAWFEYDCIYIGKNVTRIEAGVFDEIAEKVVTGITIKTAYEDKPAGWDVGWNSNIEVVWGAELYE
ncbi:MAG: hypothetical protein ILP02_04435 [Clostridia bacterium]|nr:hypothetical protein [Clostridia bacterium]